MCASIDHMRAPLEFQMQWLDGRTKPSVVTWYDSSVGVFWKKKTPFLDTESPLHTTSAAHFILSVNSTKPELGSEDSHCMELKAFSSLLLGNKASLFLAPLEGGFTVHPPGKFLLAGSQALWVPLRDAAITVLVFLCISSCCLSVSLCTLNMTGLHRLLCDITISLTKADPRDLVRGDFVLLPLSC